MTDLRAATVPMWKDPETMELEQVPCTIVDLWSTPHAWFDVVIEMEDGTRYPASLGEITLANPRSPKDVAWWKYQQLALKSDEAIEAEYKAYMEWSKL